MVRGAEEILGVQRHKWNRYSRFLQVKVVLNPKEEQLEVRGVKKVRQSERGGVKSLRRKQLEGNYRIYGHFNLRSDGGVRFFVRLKN